MHKNASSDKEVMEHFGCARNITIIKIFLQMQKMLGL